MSFLLDLGDSAARSVHVTGGKGSSLARLIEAGFEVPPGLVVTADADRAFRGADPGFEDALTRLEPARPDVLRRHGRLGPHPPSRRARAEPRTRPR